MRALLPLVAAAALMAMPVAVRADAPAPPAPPVNQTPPTIGGTPKLGQTLTASPGTWSGTEPFTFTYQWLGCFGDCVQIPGATGQTYTLTRADARTSYQGGQTIIRVRVAAADPYGGTAVYSNPGVAVDAPPDRPTSIGASLNGAQILRGPASTIPELLRHNGYTGAYFSRRAGTVDVTWTLKRREDGKRVASWHAKLRRKGWVAARLRLTRLGRKRLSHAHSLTIFTHAHWSPPGGPNVPPGGQGVGSGWALSTTAPADEVGV
jgi:hypothetical protein